MSQTNKTNKTNVPTQDIADLPDNRFDLSRAPFQHLINQRVNFYGTISEFGIRPKQRDKWSVKPTILLRNLTIFYKNESFTVNHLWINKNKLLKHCKIGTICHLSGKVKIYQRSNDTYNFCVKIIRPWNNAI
jgi:hypothetical protein